MIFLKKYNEKRTKENLLYIKNCIHNILKMIYDFLMPLYYVLNSANKFL